MSETHRGEKVHSERSFNKFLDLLCANSDGQISQKPHYNRDGRQIEFFTTQAASKVSKRVNVTIQLHTSREDESIVGITIPIPGLIAIELNMGLDKPQPRKTPWLVRKWRCLLVHLKYLLRLDACSQPTSEAPEGGSVLQGQPDVDSDTDSEQEQKGSSEDMSDKAD